MKHKFIKRGLIFTLLLALIFSSTVFASADSTNTWINKASMLLLKAGFETQVLGGKIYAIGGVDMSASKVTAEVEVYDPKTDVWSTKAHMLTPRGGFCTAVVNGKIYAIGGGNDESHYLSSVEEYDPSTDTWTPKASMQYHKTTNFCTEVIDGIIYVMGGMDSNIPTDTISSVEAYDPSTNTWTPKASMHYARSNFKTEAVDGKIYAMGGESCSNGHNDVYQNTVEVYDPSANTWTLLASSLPVNEHFQTGVINNKLYVLGGDVNESNTVASVEEYDPEQNKWVSKGSMNDARANYPSVVADGKIYVMSGDVFKDGTAKLILSAEFYDPESDKWSAMASLPYEPLKLHVIDGIMYAVGGYQGNYVPSVEAYSLAKTVQTPTLTVTASPNKVKTGQKFTTEIAVHNGTNLCAEDIQIKYDQDLFTYEDVQAETGMKIYKEDKSTPGVLRFIVASEGKDNAATGDKNLFHLTFTAKKAGTGKVDITKGRIADNATLEMDVADADCGEDTITVEATKDVNRTGEYTLLDLGIDAWYNGMNASDTDSTKYDADIVADGKIDDNDLAEITAQILGNSNYAPNSYQ